MITQDSNYPKGKMHENLNYANEAFDRISNDLPTLMRYIHSIAVDHGFWDEPRNVAEMQMLAVTELAEACEGVRKPHQDEHCPAFTSEEIEIADAFIRLLDYAFGRNLRLVPAIFTKCEFNFARPMMHGGKAF